MIWSGYMVTSRGKVSHSGNFSLHPNKKEAKECAKQVGGHAWKVTEKNGAMKLKPIKVSRD